MAPLDVLTEWIFGEGAVRVVGKFVVRGTEPGGNILFAGSCVRLDGQRELVIDTRFWERWDCELLILPRRKFEIGDVYKGRRINQILVATFEDDKNWGPEYWHAPDWRPSAAK